MPGDKILIIEDDEDLRQAAEAQLERDGYEIHAVVSAELAIQVLKQSAPHLVILNLRLPGVRGLEFLKRIRAEHPETAVVVMTAFATVRTAVEAMKAGASEYLAKPVHPCDLKAIVRRSLDHHR